jgi:predicted nucleotidyltransferase
MKHLKDNREKIIAIVEGNRCFNPRVFGSMSRNLEIEEGSDIDLVVESTAQTTLFDLGRIECDLEDLFGVPVDVLADHTIREEYREQIEQDMREI